MEKFIINIHSFVDVITNSSTELFMLDTDKAIDLVKDIIREKEKEFPSEIYSLGERFHTVHIDFAQDYQLNEAFGYIDVDDAIQLLKAKGYQIIEPENKEQTKYITISIERGYINHKLKEFIEETFNVVYHTTDA